jgi:hypothetical protein
VYVDVIKVFALSFPQVKQASVLDGIDESLAVSWSLKALPPDISMYSVESSEIERRFPQIVV